MEMRNSNLCQILEQEKSNASNNAKASKHQSSEEYIQSQFSFSKVGPKGLPHCKGERDQEIHKQTEKQLSER